jgi:hypothetical protein
MAQVFDSGRAERAYFQSNSRANPARHFQTRQAFENEAKQVLDGLF